MWKGRIKIVPIIIEALEEIKKGLGWNIYMLPGHPLATELQKNTIMSTAHSTGKVLG